MFFQALNPETLTGSGSALRDAEVNAQLLVRFVSVQAMLKGKDLVFYICRVARSAALSRVVG